MNELPKHIAIIMDGNGRWAQARFMPRIAGHRAGIKAAREVVKNCAKYPIEVLTLYAFSQENWQRPRNEVNFLMDLFLKGLEDEVGMLHENNIQLRFIGNRKRFNEKLQQKILEVENLMQNNTGMVLLIAADYAGKWDICRAVKQALMANNMAIDELTPESIQKHLSFADLPDPDLFIRTSGEMRLSNFLLWQLAYTELYFTPCLWPDFSQEELEKAINHYQTRERRFGLSSEQLAQV